MASVAAMNTYCKMRSVRSGTIPLLFHSNLRTKPENHKHKDITCTSAEKWGVNQLQYYL